MGFETVVLSKVADVLGTDNQACFTYGTLFVNCTPLEADKIEAVLSEVAGTGIIVTCQGNTGEVSFDFI